MLKYIENHLEKKIDAQGGLHTRRDDIWRLCYSLWILGVDFGSNAGIERSGDNFTDAYVHGKTITRAKPRRRTVAEDIHTGDFITANMGSQGAASEPRDYIYATMPAFPWYKYPLNAENMAFGELFLDLYNQAARKKHTFAPKITASMIQSSATDTSNAWLPSKQQPEPQCLGDFLKLLGQRLATETPNNVSRYHVTTTVRVLGVEGDIHFDILLMIQSAIRFSREIWRDSHVGGELSKHGSYLNSTWDIDIPNATYNPENQTDPCPSAMDDDGPTVLTEEPIIEFATTPAELQNTIGSSTANHHVDYVSNFEHSQRILGAVRCALESKSPSFERFQHEMKSKWSKQVLYTLALFTAVVNCQIGLSAAEWVGKHFVPVTINYDKDNVVLGLLAKHACPSQAHESKLMMSVGCHVRSGALGKDLVLFDLATPSAPVGIIPDFCYRFSKDKEDYEERMRVLYNGLGKVVAPGEFAIDHVSPEDYAAKLLMRMQENLQCAPRGLLSKPLGLTLSRYKHSFSIRCLQLIWSKEDDLFQCSASYPRPAAKSDDYAPIFKGSINP